MVVFASSAWTFVSAFDPALQNGCGYKSAFVCDLAAASRRNNLELLGGNPVFLAFGILEAIVFYFFAKISLRQWRYGAVALPNATEFEFPSLSPSVRFQLSQIRDFEFVRSGLGVRSSLIVRFHNGKNYELTNVIESQALDLCNQFKALKEAELLEAGKSH